MSTAAPITRQIRHRRRRTLGNPTTPAGVKFTTSSNKENIGRYFADIAQQMHWLKPGLDLDVVAMGFHLAVEALPKRTI